MILAEAAAKASEDTLNWPEAIVLVALILAGAYLLGRLLFD